VLDKFELLGSLIKQGIVDPTLAIEAFAGPAALRGWHQLVLYIKEEREKRGFFLKDYEEFAQRTFEYFKDNHIEILFSDKQIDLVKEFQKKDYKYCPGTLDQVVKQEKIQKQGV
jgi:hypothetical protein